MTAFTALAHALGRRFARRGRGGTLFVSSAVSRMYPWLATYWLATYSYSSSKAYVTSLSLMLREEFVQNGVFVTILEPGPIEFEMVGRI